jgi:HEAT repeat protein
VREVNSLARDLRSARAWVRARAARTLGSFGGDETLGLLIGALTDESASVREAAVKGLGALGDVRALEPLLSLIATEREMKPSAAATALARLGRPAFEALIASLAHQSADVRFWVAVALARMGATDALPHLEAAASCENGETWTRARVRRGMEKAIVSLRESDRGRG